MNCGPPVHGRSSFPPWAATVERRAEGQREVLASYGITEADDGRADSRGDGRCAKWARSADGAPVFCSVEALKRTAFWS